MHQIYTQPFNQICEKCKIMKNELGIKTKSNGIRVIYSEIVNVSSAVNKHNPLSIISLLLIYLTLVFAVENRRLISPKLSLHPL